MNLYTSFRSNLDWKKMKFIFLCVFSFGLVAHGFCYFNGNFSHDSLFSIYEESPEINIAVGRFLRPVYRMLRGNFALPVVNGFLSLFYLSLAVYLLADILELRRKSLLAITCGILTVNTTVSLMNATYFHDSDAYMLSLLLALAGVWAAQRLRHGIYWSVLFYFCSLGIYQAYIDAAIYVFLILALVGLLKGERVKQVYLDALKKLLPIAAAMVLYYIALRLTQHFAGVSDGDYYNTISNVTAFSLCSIPKRFYTCLFADAVWFLLPSGHNPWTVRIINVLMLLIGLYFVISLIRFRRLSRASVLGILGVLAAIPFGMNAITLISDMFHALTLYALYLSYVLVLVLAELYMDAGKPAAHWSRVLSGVLTGILIFDGCLFSNESYLKKNLESSATLSVFTRMVGRMEATPGFVPGQTRVAFVGLLLDGPLSYGSPGFCYTNTGMGHSFSVSYHDTYETYLNYYLGYPADCVDSKEIIEYEHMEEVIQMPIFPAEGSVRMVGDVIVIKLSDPLAVKEEA